MALQQQQERHSASPSTTASTRSSTKPMARPCAAARRQRPAPSALRGARRGTHHQGDNKAGGCNLCDLLAHRRNLQDLQARHRLRSRQPSCSRGSQARRAPSLQKRAAQVRDGSAGPSPCSAAACARSGPRRIVSACRARSAAACARTGRGLSGAISCRVPIRRPGRPPAGGQRTAACGRRTGARRRP